MHESSHIKSNRRLEIIKDWKYEESESIVIGIYDYLINMNTKVL